MARKNFCRFSYAAYQLVNYHSRYSQPFHRQGEWHDVHTGPSDLEVSAAEVHLTDAARIDFGLPLHTAPTDTNKTDTPPG